MIPYTDVGGPETDTSDGEVSVTGIPSGSFFPDDAEEQEEENQSTGGATGGVGDVATTGETSGSFIPAEKYLLGGVVGLGAIFLLWRGSQ